MRAGELADYFLKRKTRRLSERDQVETRGDTTVYYLWGHPIAALKGDLLTVKDCGWQSWLTKDRLNNILREFGIYLYGDRGKWFIGNHNHSYYWEEEHTIDLSIKPYKITPCKLRRRNPKLAQTLRALHQRIGVVLAKSITLMQVDGGETTIFFKHNNHRGFRRDYLLVTVKEDYEIKGVEGEIHPCVAYKAIISGKLGVLFESERNEAFEVDKGDLMGTIRAYAVDPLPPNSKLIRALALRKIIFQEE
jgi:hypothetical protein